MLGLNGFPPQGRVRHKRVVDLSIAVYACRDRICLHIRLEEGEEGCASTLRCARLCAM